MPPRTRDRSLRALDSLQASAADPMSSTLPVHLTEQLELGKGSYSLSRRRALLIHWSTNAMNMAAMPFQVHKKPSGSRSIQIRAAVKAEALFTLSEGIATMLQVNILFNDGLKTPKQGSP